MNVLQELERLNDINTQLIEQSLQFVNHSLHIITEDTKENYTYTNPTEKGTLKGRRGIFDKKV